MAQYRLVTGSVTEIAKRIEEKSDEGYKVVGNVFSTGNVLQTTKNVDRRDQREYEVAVLMVWYSS